MEVSLQGDSLDLSVVIPCLNEGPNLYRLLPALREALDALGAAWEVIAVDGASKDGTDKIVEKAGMRYVCETARGYGAAVVRGMAEARGRYVLTMDADMSH
ncbi:MAG TPA: glycosyltransferase family 2 protein, partial [Candidatus Hydrogenedentes bacterium]|nr:glycosyltransferase family 2 protein [Candidatus Hydrogenedentota bacterium]